MRQAPLWDQLSPVTGPVDSFHRALDAQEDSISRRSRRQGCAGRARGQRRHLRYPLPPHCQVRESLCAVPRTQVPWPPCGDHFQSRGAPGPSITVTLTPGSLSPSPWEPRQPGAGRPFAAGPGVTCRGPGAEWTERIPLGSFPLRLPQRLPLPAACASRALSGSLSGGGLTQFLW